MITIWMAVSLGGGTAFLCVVQSVFMYAKCLLLQFIKKKKRLVISGKVIRSVLPLQYCSTSLKVLEYFLCSTVVLSWKYWFYERVIY